VNRRFVGVLIVLASLLAGTLLYQREQPPVSGAQQGGTVDQAQTAQGGSFDFGRAKLESEQNTIGIVSQNDASIVFISASTAPTTAQPDPNDPFGFFFGPQGQQQPPQQGSGSGFVIDNTGLILTNNHVVTLDSNNVGQLKVQFHNDPKTYPAKVVGRSPAFDVALIKVDAPGREFQPMKLGNSDEVKVGQKAIAMGNPFGLQFTVTEGIISATGRQFEGSDNLATNVLQTDAAVNPGNSGGPLLNSNGEVVGINTAIISPGTQFSGTGQFAGIAFAVPINLVKGLLNDLKAGKVIDEAALVASRPRLGVTIAGMERYPEQVKDQYDLPEAGVMVTDVEAGAPAAQAGLKAPSKFANISGQRVPVEGDVITAINGQPLQTEDDLRRRIFASKPGDTVKLTVERAGKSRDVDVELRVVPAGNR
jgi:serine protease Do